MSEIKSFSFPTVSPTSMDFEGCGYSVDIKRLKEGAEVLVAHNFSGEGLIGELLDAGDASFACVVSLPSTMYRRIFVHDCKERRTEQKIDYKKSGYGQNDSSLAIPMFRPVIITTKDVRMQAEKQHNLSQLWRGTELHFPKGGIIAYSHWERFGGAEGGWFSIVKDDELDDGQLYVRENTEGGFRFKIFVSANIFGKLQQSEKERTGQTNSVITHAISEAFRILRDGYKDDAWKEHVNLRLLADHLKHHDLPHWTEDGFDPARVATAINPHAFPAEEGDDDDD